MTKFNLSQSSILHHIIIFKKRFYSNEHLPAIIGFEVGELEQS